MADDEENVGYRWESEYEKTWEAIKENEDGLIQPNVEELIQQAKRQRLLQKKNVRLGMMRYVNIIIDMSESMLEQDLKPTRIVCTLKLLEGFVQEFYDQNPISQLSLYHTKNKRADKVTDLDGNSKRHIDALKTLLTISCSGEPSLQNSLELAAKSLKNMPGHTSKEILIIFGSLSTCDPGNIYTTIEALKSFGIRCSVIGLSAQVQVFNALTKATKGTYDIILDETHFKEMVYQHLAPPPAALNMESSLIRMGFPCRKGSEEGEPTMCVCHLDSTTNEGFGIGGYFCTQCNSKYCDLPVECKCCGLILVSAPHLARSYHHLFQLDSFSEVQISNLDKNCNKCFGCQAEFKGTLAYSCQKCSNVFCFDCDLFIHDTLHTCPGCAGSKRN